MFANSVLLALVLMSVKINKSPTIESKSSLWKFDEVQRGPDALTNCFIQLYKPNENHWMS